ncbi:hypothetical protein D3C80_1793870 [compost metagenome]
MLAQPRVAGGVFGAVVVVRAVGFDDQAVTQADEVSHVSPNHDLSPELQPVQPPVPQNGPQPPLIEGGLAAHRLGAGVQPVVHRARVAD